MAHLYVVVAHETHFDWEDLAVDAEEAAVERDGAEELVRQSEDLGGRGRVDLSFDCRGEGNE